MFLLVLAALTCLLSAAMLLQIVLGYRSARHLREASPRIDRAPRVSVIVAARNEERAIESALASLLALDYPDYEVIVVDDRSEDGTGAILDRMARDHSLLRVLHVEQLPPGWLGKNHALQRGAEMATGSWLLLTDADVVFHPEALARAVTLAGEMQADHLAAMPEVPAPTLPLAAALVFFNLGFSLALKPWKASDPASKRFVGFGAFNLVRAASFRAVGGLERIRLRPDDDIRLGQLLKASGARQSCVGAFGFLTVIWYQSLPEMVRGLRKNIFAGLRYRVSLAALSVTALAVIHIWPFAAVWLTSGATRILYIASVILLMALYAWLAALSGKGPWLALLYPLTAAVSLFIVCDAVLRTLWRGGIEWRGTFYSLDELRANRV